MSFSSEVKKEIIRMDREKECCILAEIAGFVRMCGSVKKSNKLTEITISTENPAIARLFLKLIKEHFDPDAKLMIDQNKTLKKNRFYELYVTISSKEKSEQILGENDFLKTRCCKRAYLRGVFLGAGTVSHPERSYHMEIVCNKEGLAQDIMDIINSFGLKSKIAQRRNNYIVYLKESEQISDFLAVLGTSNQVFEFENVRIIKELRNKTNRIVNCESANMDKTIDSAAKQIETINFLNKRIGLDNLPIKLKEVARLRLENPESSLAELGQMLDPPLQKSGVNHRFRKLEEVASKMRG